MDMGALSLEQASQLYDRQSRVDQVREDAEKILGKKLPPLFSSKFIEEFCGLVPEIGVFTIKFQLDTRSTLQNCTFLTDLMVKRDGHPESWFCVEVFGVENLDQGEPLCELRSEGSPAETLASFVSQFSELLQSADADGRLHQLSDNELIDLVGWIKGKVDSFRYHGIGLAEPMDPLPLPTDGLKLSQILECPTIVPPDQPSDSLLNSMLVTTALEGKEVSYEKKFEFLKDLSKKQLEEYVSAKCQALIGALGEVRPVGSQDPLFMFRQFRHAQELNSAAVRLRIATAYVSLCKEEAELRDDQQANQLLQHAVRHATEKHKAAQKRASNGSDFIKESAEAQAEYYKYVRDAIIDNQQVLEKLLSN